jgi:hypothetical protein
MGKDPIAETTMTKSNEINVWLKITARTDETITLRDGCGSEATFLIASEITRASDLDVGELALFTVDYELFHARGLVTNFERLAGEWIRRDLRITCYT